MNILAKVLQVLMMVPGIVQGIEVIHGDAKSGADKKQLALESLGLAGSVAAAVAPGEQQQIVAVTQFAADTIDKTVSLFNQFGWAHPAVTPPATKA
jgi:hypothetical protein